MRCSPFEYFHDYFRWAPNFVAKPWMFRVYRINHRRASKWKRRLLREIWQKEPSR